MMGVPGNGNLPTDDGCGEDCCGKSDLKDDRLAHFIRYAKFHRN
ncbi:hypothetical protein [Leptolyngbya sp. FACHB-36]|nr:hypothetical protein [Leptolyngbya sp. FACHB-36]